MNILTRDDLRNQLKKSEIAPVYLLFGAESYLRDLAAKTITDLVLKDAPLREFNETDVSLSDTDFQAAISYAEQLPMIASRRVVKIRDVNKFREQDEDALAAYTGRPAASAVLIFVADELDKRRRFAKILIEGSVAVEFNALSDVELTTWAKGEFKKSEVHIDERALKDLILLVGSNLQRLSNEIEKLSVAALPEKMVTYELVESLISNSRELSNFALTDHLQDKNRLRALEVLRKILDDGAEPLMLLGLIATHFRRMFLAKEMMEQGVQRSDVARNLKLPYSRQEDFLASARRADAKRLAHILKKIAETDLNIKTSKSGPQLLLEVLVAEIAA